MIPLLFMATIYTYHWIPCTTSGIIKAIMKKPVWKKTPRFNEKNKLSKITVPLEEENRYQTVVNR
jgi:hypothetical protein